MTGEAGASLPVPGASALVANPKSVLSHADQQTDASLAQGRATAGACTKGACPASGSVPGFLLSPSLLRSWPMLAAFPVQVYTGYANPATVHHFSLLQARQAHRGAHFHAFSTVRLLSSILPACLSEAWAWPAGPFC